jgi:hypothetical protein
VRIRGAVTNDGLAVYCRSTTGNDTYTCSLVPDMTAYTRGGCLVLDADTSNTGTATLNVDSLGAKDILSHTGGALANSDISANKPKTLCYDGTQFIIQGDGGAAGGSTANYEETFSAVTTLTATGAEHGFGHRKILVACYDDSTPRAWIEPNTVTVDSSTFDVVVTFSTSETGLCVFSGQGGSGAITSIASQTGATQTITRGAGIGGTSGTNDHSFTTASGEADFLASGALTCGASTQGKMQVHTTPLQYCDNAGTPALQYAAYGNTTGESTAAGNNSVALGTDTVNDYIASLSNGIGLTGFPAAGETATGTVAFDFSQTLAGNPAYNAKECVFTTEGTSGGGFLCEGSTGGNTNEQLYLFPALDGVDTTTFIALAASDGDALAGDSATAFFDAGQIEAARGGTGDDTSASTGVPRIASGNWTYDAGISHLASSTSADLAGVLSDETGSAGGFMRATSPTNVTLDVEDTGNSVTTVSYVILEFASCVGAAAFVAWDDDGGGGTEPAAACNDTGAIQRPSADFSGSAVNLVHRTFQLPADWASAEAVDITIRHVAVAASPTGNVEFDISTVCRTVGETWDGTFNAAQTITDAVAAQNTLNDATQAAVTMTGCAAGEDLTIQVSRDGTNDTNNDLSKALYAVVTLRRAQ